MLSILSGLDQDHFTDGNPVATVFSRVSGKASQAGDSHVLMSVY